MTEREAIYHLCRISEIIPGYCRSEAFVAIGAQKRVANIPAEEKHRGNKYKGKCTCGNHVKQYDAYCKRCGQKLEWE